jgi:hypothetical protein
MYYPRYYDAKLAEEKNKLLKPGRVLIVYGPRSDAPAYYQAHQNIPYL